MWRPLSHDCSPPGGGAACGKSLVTELVTLRLSAGWLEISPARLVAANNVKISDATAIVLNVFPVPPKASRYQRSDPIASSFDSETFACRPLTDSSLSPEREFPAQPSPQLARTLLLIVPLTKARIYLVDEFFSKATSSSRSLRANARNSGLVTTEKNRMQLVRAMIRATAKKRLGLADSVIWPLMSDYPASGTLP